jgi:hypothetical protein
MINEAFVSVEKLYALYFASPLDVVETISHLRDTRQSSQHFTFSKRFDFSKITSNRCFDLIYTLLLLLCCFYLDQNLKWFLFCSSFSCVTVRKILRDSLVTSLHFFREFPASHVLLDHSSGNRSLVTRYICYSSPFSFYFLFSRSDI